MKRPTFNAAQLLSIAQAYAVSTGEVWANLTAQQQAAALAQVSAIINLSEAEAASLIRRPRNVIKPARPVAKPVVVPAK